jgi:hypothetical protein
VVRAPLVNHRFLREARTSDFDRERRFDLTIPGSCGLISNDVDVGPIGGFLALLIIGLTVINQFS